MTAPRPRGHQADSQEAIIAELIDEHVEVDDDVIEIDAETWAIHGQIAYEGEVIAATFSSEERARAALDRLEHLDRD